MTIHRLSWAVAASSMAAGAVTCGSAGLTVISAVATAIAVLCGIMALAERNGVSEH